MKIHTTDPLKTIPKFTINIPILNEADLLKDLTPKTAHADEIVNIDFSLELGS